MWHAKWRYANESEYRLFLKSKIGLQTKKNHVRVFGRNENNSNSKKESAQDTMESCKQRITTHKWFDEATESEPIWFWAVTMHVSSAALAIPLNFLHFVCSALNVFHFIHCRNFQNESHANVQKPLLLLLLLRKIPERKLKATAITGVYNIINGAKVFKHDRYISSQYESSFFVITESCSNERNFPRNACVLERNFTVFEHLYLFNSFTPHSRGAHNALVQTDTLQNCVCQACGKN